jgi:DNA polymerase-3 subunit alpha
MIELNGQGSAPDLDLRLGEILSPFQQGGCKVNLRYSNSNASAVMELGPEWRVSPTDELLKRLGKAFGDEGVTVKY